MKDNYDIYRYDYLFKVILVGNSGVGKTSMLSRYVDKVFDSNFLMTIGVDFKVRTLDVGGKIVKLQIWDTAGQERFRTITTTYYRGSNGIIVVYDVSNRDSFLNVQQWLSEITRYSPENVTKILIGNKCDLSERQVTYDEAKKFADDNNISYIETSAKQDINVNLCFTKIIEKIRGKMENKKLESSNEEKKINIVGGKKVNNENTTYSCC